MQKIGYATASVRWDLRPYGFRFLSSHMRKLSAVSEGYLARGNGQSVGERWRRLPLAKVQRDLRHYWRYRPQRAPPRSLQDRARGGPRRQLELPWQRYAANQGRANH